MPHYRDGQLAEIGDLVAGVTYNRNGRKIVGTILSITPGFESCNCRVAFIAEADITKVYGTVGGALAQIGKAGEPQGQVFLRIEDDYGETRAFDLIARKE